MSGAPERTFVLFKPDVYDRNLFAEISTEIGDLGLTRLEEFQVRFSPEGIFHLWPRIYGRRWTSSLMDDMPRRPLHVRVLEGLDAIGRVIAFKDAKRTSRAEVNSYRNLLHSPDSDEEFRREYAFLGSIRI